MSKQNLLLLKSRCSSVSQAFKYFTMGIMASLTSPIPFHDKFNVRILEFFVRPSHKFFKPSIQSNVKTIEKDFVVEITDLRVKFVPRQIQLFDQLIFADNLRQCFATFFAQLITTQVQFPYRLISNDTDAHGRQALVSQTVKTQI